MGPTITPTGYALGNGLENASWVSIPPPYLPPFRVGSDRALVTTARGDQADEVIQLTRPYLERYARRHGADFHCVNYSDCPGWGMAVKFNILPLLPRYSTVVYVDSDVLLTDASVNLFTQATAEEFAAVDQLPFIEARPEFGREAEYQTFRQLWADKPSWPVPFMWNAGVMVLSPRVHDLLVPPLGPFPAYHCAEEDWINHRILSAYQTGLIKVRNLDRRCNWQWWTDPGFLRAPDDAVLHFSGMPHRHRVAAIRSALRRLPLPPPAAGQHQAGNGNGRLHRVLTLQP